MKGPLIFEYLRSHLKDCLVPVANCSRQHFNSHEKSEISLHKYFDWWERFIESGHQETTTEPLLYLKDLHPQQEEDESFYSVPQFFQSDWLNEFLIESQKQDYRFVQEGPQRFMDTPFHSDVFSSFSWSTNIVGEKRWIFLEAGQEKLLLGAKDGKLPFSISPEDLQVKNIPYYELIQGPNEAVFVPSGWFHQVWNLEDTISINHNLFNGTQIDKILAGPPHQLGLRDRGARQLG